jgi:hypothetical protein
LGLQQQNIFPGLRRSGTISTNRKHKTEQGRRRENNEDIVPPKSHIPSSKSKLKFDFGEQRKQDSAVIDIL